MLRTWSRRCLGVVATWFGLAAVMCDVPLSAGGKDIIRKLTLDETLPVVELFEGIAAEQLQVTMSAKSAHESNVFVRNLSDEPLTVSVPKAVVGVHILPQIFGQGNNGIGQNLFGNNQNNGQNDNGRGQTVGGGLSPFGNQQGFPNQNGNGGNFNGMNGNGFFSIPPEKTVQLKFRSVCLDYGLPDPHPGMKYQLRKLESEISNPVLQELLENYSPRSNRDATQAAAWHLANGLSWNQIMNLPPMDATSIVGGTMFSPATVKSAQKLVRETEESAKQREKSAPPAAEKVVVTGRSAK